MVRPFTVLIMCLICSGRMFAQPYDVVFEKKSNYSGWGTAWDSVYTVKNGIVTIAVVPKIGGRVMQYDLGTHSSIYISAAAKGTIPADGNVLVGGFRMLPSPQYDFGWPSPPNLDLNPYTCTVPVNSADSAVIDLASQVENSTDSKYVKHKGLQFKRRLTFYKASTRVKVEMTMLNKGTQTLTHGIWDITQTACPNTNCWVYFQRNPTSILGGNKGYVQYTGESPDAAAAAAAATQWKPDAAPGGIMGVQYLAKVGKIGADCKAGWICFNDRQAGYAFVKTFTYENNKNYPDSGASVQVYTYDDTKNMLEVEVLGPLTALAPNDSVKLTENWYAARSFGPVLEVNKAGLVTSRLTAVQTGDTMSITGTYGIFAPGKVYAQFSSSTSTAATVDSFTVTPDDSLHITKKYRVPPGATLFHLAAFSLAGTIIGTLDTISVPNPVSTFSKSSRNRSAPRNVSMIRTVSGLVLTNSSTIPSVVTVHALNGRTIFTGVCASRSKLPVPLSTTADGILIVRVENAEGTASFTVPAASGRTGSGQ